MYFYPADILLPDFHKVSGTKWATVACDQFTGEPEYWFNAEEIVGDSPSTLKLMIPEAFLSESEIRTPLVNEAMNRYLDSVLVEHKSKIIYLERLQSDGRIRRGLIGMIDLEDYDYSIGSTSRIRATEGTVLSRIPPRVEVRRHAKLEMPHIMMLINDKENTVFSGLSISCADAYDFSLMLGGGAVRAKFLSDDEADKTIKSIEKLGGDSGCKDPLIFAVGDGNHSLATAKALYEEIKARLGDKAKTHPARYALTEVVNLYDPALDFEPIFRIVTGCDPKAVLCEFEDYCERVSVEAEANGTDNRQQEVKCLLGEETKILTIKKPLKNITVATVQDFIDDYIEKNPGCEVDYIHGEDSIAALSRKENSIGFLFEGINKDGFFETIIKDGAFPRKTFSMGHAHDKRYYIECRRIVE